LRVFHRGIASLIAGLPEAGDVGSLRGEVEEFMPKVGLMGLRELLERYPKLEATGGESASMESASCEGTRAP
jgi:hypothetical protein